MNKSSSGDQSEAPNLGLAGLNEPVKKETAPNLGVAERTRSGRGKGGPGGSLKSADHFDIPYGTTSIGTVPGGERHIWNFGNAASITIPDTVTIIGDNAFAYSVDLQSVTIPDSVASIGSSTFMGCGRLKNVTIPNSVKTIGGSAFQGCICLEHVTLPDGLTAVEEQTFFGCNSLTKIKIPDSVVSIGPLAFSGCSLENLTLPESVVKIGKDAFENCVFLKTAAVSDSMKSVGFKVFAGCRNLTAVTVKPGSRNFRSVDGVVFSGDGKTLVWCPGGKAGEYTVPDSVAVIGEGAFSSCGALYRVTLPRSVVSIERNAFDSPMGNWPKHVTVLNPECRFCGEPDVVNFTVILRGRAGSTAEAYAKKYGAFFEPLA